MINIIQKLKKIFTTFAVVCAVLTFAMPSMVFAANDAVAKPNVIPCLPNSALPCISNQTQEKVGAVKTYIVDTVGQNVLRWFLGITAIAAVIFYIIGGTQMLLGLGNEENVTKGKKTIILTSVGLMVAILAAAIVRIVINLI